MVAVAWAAAAAHPIWAAAAAVIPEGLGFFLHAQLMHCPTIPAQINLIWMEMITHHPMRVLYLLNVCGNCPVNTAPTFVNSSPQTLNIYETSGANDINLLVILMMMGKN